VVLDGVLCIRESSAQGFGLPFLNIKKVVEYVWPS
jgi:hypothetical protein